jgi:TRAP-type C4-dicarboxylate transport system permease small subunit
VNGLVASLLFGALTVVVALQVFTRFVLHAPFIWSEELARFLFFWVVLLGSAMSVRDRRHFVLDVSPGGHRKHGRIRRFVADAVPDLLVLGFSILLLVEGIGYARVGLLRVATNSQLNMALVYAAIPVFAVLSVLYTASHLARAYATLRRGGEEAAPPAGSE